VVFLFFKIACKVFSRYSYEWSQFFVYFFNISSCCPSKNAQPNIYFLANEYPSTFFLANKYLSRLFFFAGEEEALHRKHYRKDPTKHKITAPSFCKLTTPSTRRCRRWRAAAAASLDALDRRQSPGEREVAERRSQRTYTVERRRGGIQLEH
jgi:hypothetical protein